MSASDAEILAGCRAGDPRAWAALVDRHGPLLLRALQVRFRSPQDAEEAFQDLWVHLMQDGGRRLRTIDAGRPLGPYLLAVSLHLSRRRSRSAKKAQPLADAGPVDPRPAPPDALVARELRTEIGEALERLSPRDRLILRLGEVEGLPHALIGKAVGVASASVSALLGRARERLRTRLERPS
jgi:RNA polymerase sigma factor (sigma-70 family)